MIIFAIIIGIAIIFLSVLCIQFISEETPYSWGVLCGFVIFALIVLEMLCIDKIVSEPRPKAMDVYQGKTTIEYTIRDGVKVDSVVVWKDGIK